MSERFAESHKFPRELNKGALQDIFYSIDTKIGTRTKFENSSMNAFISKTYEEGAVWAEMSFEAKPSANSESRYSSVTLWAEIPWRTRKELVSRLNTEVRTALEDYFKQL